MTNSFWNKHLIFLIFFIVFVISLGLILFLLNINLDKKIKIQIKVDEFENSKFSINPIFFDKLNFKINHQITILFENKYYFPIIKNISFDNEKGAIIELTGLNHMFFPGSVLDSWFIVEQSNLFNEIFSFV